MKSRDLIESHDHQVLFYAMTKKNYLIITKLLISKN